MFTHSFTICSFDWFLHLHTICPALRINSFFIVHFNNNAIVVHHTTFNWLDHIVSFCFDTIVTDEGEKYVKSNLEWFLALFFQSGLVHLNDFFGLFSNFITVNWVTFVLDFRFTNELIENCIVSLACFFLCCSLTICTVYIHFELTFRGLLDMARVCPRSVLRDLSQFLCFFLINCWFAQTFFRSLHGR